MIHMKNEYIAYMLVFAACAAVLWVLWSTAVAAGLAQGEKLDFENNLTADGRQKKPIERFVSPGALFGTACFPQSFRGLLFLWHFLFPVLIPRSSLALRADCSP